mgnify:CR=1 FL=1
MENTKKTAAALGFFDGLHIGHKAVIRTAAAAGQRLGISVSVLTFRGFPDLPKFGGRRDMCLMTYEDKKELLSVWGADNVFAYEFADIRNMSPEEFFEDIVIRKMNAAFVCCGGDFRFGKGGRGDVALLSGLCERHGTGFEIVPPEKDRSGVPISSSHIRELIRDGNVSEAFRQLGQWYSLTLPVQHGRELGRTMGFPTINQVIPDYMVHPKRGVYASLVEVPGETAEFPAITDIGIKPTVDSNGSEVMETHIIGYTGDLYGKTVRVKLHKFIRPEQKFSSLDDLQKQLISDKNTAQNIFSERIKSLS